VRPGDLYVRETAIPQFNTPQGAAFPVPNLGYTVDDEAHFLTRVPLSYAGGDLVWAVSWFAAATAGNVQWSVSLAAVAHGGAQSILTKAYAAGVAAQSVASGTANAPVLTSGTLTGASLDGVAAGDLLSVRVQRVAASADEMAGDALFTVLTLRQ
jgi:hypothetical protein